MDLEQVGWYCNHEDERNSPPRDSSHMSHHGKYTKRKGWVETYPEPNVSKSLAFLDYADPSKRPHCPRAIPVYISATEGN